MADLTAALHTSVTSLPYPPPAPAFIAGLIAARTPPPPLPALAATARARLLAADLTSPATVDVASPAAAALAFPPGLGAPREQRLPRDVVVQVLDVEDVARARWAQVEELEALERGEGTRGRQVVRLPASGGDDDGAGSAPDDRPAPAPTAGGTHRLVLQDCRGQKVAALELRRVARIGVGSLHIGEKLVIRAGTVVARGTVLLEPANCVFLGGKVEPWHKAWVDGRLARLREAVGVSRDGNRG